MIKIKKTMCNDDILKELQDKQIDDVDHDNKLQYSDLKRMCKYVNTSIFDENQCCLWKGYVTNSNNSDKCTYINFYFKKKKTALHRLMYSNFVEKLTSDYYLKFNCENKGKCCNIAHLKKFKFNITKKKNIEIKITKSEPNDQCTKKVLINTNKNKLILSFD
jgi:hypothetical protein